jgi:hypothetical protein
VPDRTTGPDLDFSSPPSKVLLIIQPQLITFGKYLPFAQHVPDDRGLSVHHGRAGNSGSASAFDPIESLAHPHRNGAGYTLLARATYLKARTAEPIRAAGRMLTKKVTSLAQCHLGPHASIRRNPLAQRKMYRFSSRIRLQLRNLGLELTF